MYTAKQMIVVRRDLKMRKGKIAAQAGHACVNAVLMALSKENLLDKIRFEEDGLTLTGEIDENIPVCQWILHGEAKICVYVDSEEELLEIDRKA